MNGSNPVPMLNGMQLVASPLLVKTKRISRTERKWAQRVMHQRSRRFDDKFAIVPSDEVLVGDGKIFAHPAMIERIKQAMDQVK